MTGLDRISLLNFRSTYLINFPTSASPAAR
jgi:hypothetical protein